MDKASIRKNIAYHRIEGKNLFIIPLLPTWFVLSDEEAIALNLFLELNNETKIIHNLASELQISNSEAERVYKNTINILKYRKVYPENETLILAPDAGKYPTNIHLALTHRCNLRCKHCYISAGNESLNELTLEGWKDGFDNLFSSIPKPDVECQNKWTNIF